MGAVFRRSSSSSNLRYSRAASRSDVGDGLDGDGEESADCAGESRVPRRRSRGEPYWSGRPGLRRRRRAGWWRRRRRRAACWRRRHGRRRTFGWRRWCWWLAGGWRWSRRCRHRRGRCRRRFRLREAPWGGAARAAQATAARVAGYGAAPFLWFGQCLCESCGCSGCVLVRFAPDPASLLVSYRPLARFSIIPRERAPSCA